MASQTSLLLLGATGFIGGTVLTQLKTSELKEVKSLAVTALVRKQGQADLLRDKGVDAVVLPGGLDDTEGLANLASQHDVVVQAAYGYHPASAEALISGLARRQKERGGSPFYVQVSGTTSFAESDLSGGAGREGRGFSDKDEGLYEYEVAREEELSYVQRALDVRVVRAGEELGVRTYLVVPPHVYGRGTGYFNRASQIIPFMAKNALQAGKVEYILPGTSRYGYVHVEDLATLFEVTIARALEDPGLAARRRGYFFANTGEYTWFELAEAITRAGHELGALSSAEPAPVELGSPGVKPWGVDDAMTERVFASSAITRAERGYEIGWRPSKTEEDWKTWIPEEFGVIYRGGSVEE
ncbi:related to NAD dependent epimerase/dehydratase family protein [Cephalotrichum gorgonifer]|uniref:Related to NAD dependent epimerase/dehydratase family protein n=1 Tax=Cephalotrichum gorgonifer TaxID=2041049 RepID=A0AAE8N3T5_9PEZI|nr:related to NAD dependent epimerase/dehydratase family protein [Cephalotrichum gorgonifer]